MTELTQVAPRRPATRGGPAVSRAVLVPVVVLLLITILGSGYYFAPVAERVRNDLHPWLRPSGRIGQTAGILSFLGFLFLWLYPLRKKLGPKAPIGSVGKWLDVHIVVGLSIPLLGAVHAAWRFQGIIGLGFWAMLVVSLSGVIGRYVYVRIPRSRTGLELSSEDAAKERRQILVELAGMTGLERAVVESVLAAEPVSHERQGVLAGLWQMVHDDFARRRGVRQLERKWKALGPERPELDPKALRRVAALARRQMSLGQQLRLLEQTQRIFRHWHTLHRPVALTALLAVTIHVVVVVLVGSTWFY